jgi:hypothetical protein
MKDSNTRSLLPLIAGKASLLIAAVMAAPIAAQAAECQYAVIDEWNQGFKAEISIVNSGEPINDWQLEWSWDDGTTFNNGWNATYACLAGHCIATPPSWMPVINTNQTYTFGFIADKAGNPADANVTVNGTVCDNAPVPAEVSWQLDGNNSSVHYVSMKKEHVAENNTFLAADGEPAALSGSISNSGEVIFAIDLNDVSTGVDIRNSRLLALLFETNLLPTAYFRTNIDVTALAQMTIGDVRFETLSGEFSLHAMRQTVSADVIIAKKSATEISVATVKPVHIDSKNFDMANGIEALRVVANLSSIGEVVPVYFQLNYLANTDTTVQPVDMAEAPQDPTTLVGSFDEATLQASLDWQDNSDDETRFLVRRKPVDGNWQTTAELSANSTSLTEGLPDLGEYDYKVIALNNGVPSLPSNIERVTVTEGDPVVRGEHLYQEQCAACHGVGGEDIDSFPPLNTQRDLDTMITYIVDNMPLGNASSCDQECAENIAAFIETLWVTEVACDINLTPVSYGARQLKILTRSEYQNSVEDLLGVDFNASDGLSADSKVSFFTNNTYAAIIPSSYSNYLLVAEEIAQWSADRDFTPALSCTSYNQDCADQFIDTLAPKIFRRPLTEDEVTSYQEMANGTHTSGDVKSGIQMALEGMLSSPQFLYRHELGETNPDNPTIDSDAFELTSYEMATFLAYTYTGSTPDQLLLDAAALDELRTEAQIVSHAQRLAGGAKQVMGDFVGSWLGTADLEVAAKDPSVWPGFEDLVPHMQNEINETFSHIMLDPSEQFASLYSGNYTFLNATLAQHYGIGSVSGNDLQKVDTTDRGGVLANGAFMARWGEAVETSPILRSVRVRRRMLCQDQPDPPAGTFEAREAKLAELAEFLQDTTTTNRMKYHRLTEDAPCTNCHLQYINPLGFGMEDFDTVGRIRSTDLNGNAIDVNGELYAPLDYSDVSAQESFFGTRGLGTVLSGLPSAQSCLPKQMFRYFMGVGYQDIDNSNPDGPQLSDEEKSGYACEIDELTDTMMNSSPRAMLESFGSLEAVRYRKAWSRD